MSEYRLTQALSFQLISRTVGAISLCLAIAFIGLYMAIARVIDRDLDDDMLEDIQEFNVVYRQGGDEAVIAEMQRETQGGDNESVFLRFLDGNNRLLYTTDLHHWGDIQAESARVSVLASESGLSDLTTLSNDLMDTDARMIVGNIGPNRVLQIGESLESRNDIMELLLGALGFVFLAALPMAGVFGWIATRRATRGIKAVSDAAMGIQNGNLNSRATVRDQSNEIEYLASSFNAMADRINGLINDMREMTDNIAHDLRSPLGRIRAIAETAVTGVQSRASYRNSAEKCMAECDRLIKLINTSLDVAETEAGVAKLTIEEVNLAALADEACELFDPVADEKNIELLKDIDGDNMINGDRQSLLRMLLNLIDNALKYTPANGRVKVTVNSDSTAQYLEVADSGIGIPDGEKNRVFDRFYRCDQSRTDEGCGLGLSFAQAVAKLHGGEIRLSSDAVYRTVFRVSFDQGGLQTRAVS